MTPELITLGTALGGLAVGHFGTAKIPQWWASFKASAQGAEAKVAAAEHAAAHAAADAAVSAIQMLTDKSKQQAAIAKAQAEMTRMDMLLAEVKGKLGA